MLYILATAFFVASIATKAWRQKRIMMRRNIAGVEQFRSYTSFVVHRQVDKLLLFLANVLLFAGASFAAAAVFSPVEHFAREVFSRVLLL